jgi:hypothetical protein
MPFSFAPLKVLILMFAGRISRHQLDAASFTRAVDGFDFTQVNQQIAEEFVSVPLRDGMYAR